MSPFPATPLLTPALFLGAGALGLLLAWRGRAAPLVERSSWAAVPLLLAAGVFTYAATIELSTRWGWSASRLAAAVALVRGYPLYSAPDSGPINGWLYGPVPALAWAPAALASAPRPALTIAAVINVLFLLVPLAAAAGLPAGRRAPGAAGRWLAFAGGSIALLLVYPTWYMASTLNADAAAAGLGASACLAVGRLPPTRRRLWLAAFLAALAVLSKQVAAPLAAGLATWLAWRAGGRVALRFLAAHLVLVAAGLLAMVTLWDWRAVLFNLWTVPASHDVLGSFPSVAAELRAFAAYSAIFWVPLAAAALWRLPAAAAPASGPLLAAAVFILPTGVMAALKVGGDRNSIHSAYHLAVAATGALAALARHRPARGPVLPAWAVLAAAVTVAALGVRQVAGYAGLTMLPPHCLSQAAWLFARERPQQVYFPWDPLATLLADGRLDHFEYGIVDRIYAGRPPTPSHVRAHLPPRLQLVVYPFAGSQRTVLQRYLPEGSFAFATGDWIVYRCPPR